MCNNFSVAENLLNPTLIVFTEFLVAFVEINRTEAVEHN